ncbi:MAG: SDR family NAD(P)-dependent oxidoreductase [Proteobacteria bacterium]|nr:SDR family NAD(P)-dependent oxidoreductase [Pseudomonadota bacterium]
MIDKNMAVATDDKQRFTDKVILITGASDGIGKATAIQCAKEGATVIIHGKTTPKLELLYDEIVDAGHTEPVIYPLDLEKITPQDCETLSDVISKEFGRLDGMFNNAAWLGASSPIQQYDTELWFRVMHINLNASFMLTQACLPLLNHGGNSSIVFTLDDKNTAYWGAYSVSKAGLTALMQILADELENSKINVTGLLPGIVRTAMRTRAFPAEDPTSHSTVDEVAQAAAMLLDENGTMIEGEKSHGRIFKLKQLLSVIDR